MIKLSTAAYGVVALELLGGVALILGIYHHLPRARRERLDVHEQGWRLGISGVLGGRPGGSVPVR